MVSATSLLHIVVAPDKPALLKVTETMYLLNIALAKASRIDRCRSIVKIRQIVEGETEGDKLSEESSGGIVLCDLAPIDVWFIHAWILTIIH